MIEFYVVAEDWLSIYVIRQIISSYPNDFSIMRENCTNGFGTIKRDIEKYNNAAKQMPFFILTDLDNDLCPSMKIKTWLNNKSISEKMFFRIAIKEIESWILADREGFATFLNISKNNIENSPDELIDPKKEIFRLTEKCKNRNLKEALLPRNGSTIGPAYNTTLQDFLQNYWDISRAEENSPSLKKTIRALHKFSTRI